ncbi:MAG: hypothetical protein CLLPBCKN_006952 [Chroococcidiopsis cubana SAG 39.79]|nr:hypothetical protein [Chroococcidiopsis cubana SAG 39.79]
MLPPLPVKALAVILLPFKAARVSVSMVMLPPLPPPLSNPAVAEILLPSRSWRFCEFRNMFPPSPDAVAAVIPP